MNTHELISLLTIPIFMGAIGYATNWTGVWMLFYPVRFAGIRMPGLAKLAQVFPRKLQQVPGIMNGGLGWQGIIPSRAAKMGSIAVDKGIAKLGSVGDFYRRLDPEKLAEHVVRSSRGDIREIVEEAAEREHPRLWSDLSPELREAVHERVERQYPDIVDGLMKEIGKSIDQLLDIKLMVIGRMEERPQLANRVFRSVGEKELRFIINFGFFFGFACGIPVMGLQALIPQWWVLFVCGPIVGWVTNWIAILMIFEPVEPRRILGFRWQGLFLKRQQEASEVYATVIADDIVTVRNIGEELLHGARSDRTRRVISRTLRPAVDRAVGPARPAVRLAVGPREYDAISDSVATEGVEQTMTPLSDPEFNRAQSEALREMMTSRMREMSPADFSDMLRSAIRQDEWLLLAHGAVLGVVGGALHLGFVALIPS
jgi:uncharacterized membrane protein YheB (UPF0754 family)